LNFFNGTATVNAALAGATVINIAFAIQTARPKREAALAQAEQPVDLIQHLQQPNGSDLVVYHRTKAMKAAPEREDPQVVGRAAAAHQQAQSTNYETARVP
jgi:hypothetical protein